MVYYVNTKIESYSVCKYNPLYFKKLYVEV